MMKMMTVQKVITGVFSKFALSLGGLVLLAATTATRLQAAPVYEDASSVFARKAHPALTAVGGFAGSQEQLASQFASVCGDTFCAGDYSNLSSLGLTCSVDTTANGVGQCLWLFSGSYTAVAAATGQVEVHQQVFRCDLGFKGSADELAGFLAAASQAGPSGDQGLRSVLIPGRGVALMDVLVKCL